MYSLIWWSVMWRPGKSSIPLVAETNQQLGRAPPDRQTGSKKRAAGGDGSPVGLRPPFDPSPPAHSHPDCRWLLTLIVAAQAIEAFRLKHRMTGM
jgi:hypothetical protein